MPSAHIVPNVCRHTKYRFRQFSYICVGMSPLVVDCELFCHLQLLGCGPPLVSHTQVLVDMRPLWVVRWEMSPVGSPLWPTRLTSICWLRHVVLADCIISQLSHTCISSSWIGQLRSDWRFLKIGFEFHFRNCLFATGIVILFWSLLLKSSWHKWIATELFELKWDEWINN